MPLISVIVPVYNAHSYIWKCYESLKNQTFLDFEIIFINDGSTDDSLDILNNIACYAKNVTVLTQENKGQAQARNVGIKYAKGMFLCFVDIDDYVNEDMLLKMYRRQQETQADIVWCNAFLLKNGEIIGCLDDSGKYAQDTVKHYLLNNAGPWRKLIKRSIIVENDLYFPSIRFYEDLAVVPSWGLYANTIAYEKDALYYYILHEGSTMHQLEYSEKLECIFPCMEYLQEEFGSKKIQYRDEIEYLFIEHLLHAASLRFFGFKEGKGALNKIVDIMKKTYPSWMENRYFKSRDWKYKLVCYLFYKKRYGILKWIIK